MAENFSLNSAQIKGLAGLFFNLAAGLILGGIGFAVVGPIEVKLLASVFVLFMSLFLVRMALNLLRRIEE
ncbi:hypothetical protein HY085_01285 [Candidatus Gottesmanbacteria bacterium]|nr:hypothetical protein [Candidatus Gottesmanbacteria bacterium]